MCVPGVLNTRKCIFGFVAKQNRDSGRVIKTREQFAICRNSSKWWHLVAHKNVVNLSSKYLISIRFISNTKIPGSILCTWLFVCLVEVTKRNYLHFQHFISICGNATCFYTCAMNGIPFFHCYLHALAHINICDMPPMVISSSTFT